MENHRDQEIREAAERFFHSMNESFWKLYHALSLAVRPSVRAVEKIEAYQRNPTRRNWKQALDALVACGMDRSQARNAFPR